MADNYQIDLTLEEIFGTGISSIEQTTVSTVPGGINVWTVTLTNGNIYNFNVMNGTAGGDPVPVLSSADMTDLSAIYLYLGTETEFTFGHWYYNDGSWIDGGAYGAKGDKGDDGAAGFSPTASVSKSGTTTTITITDENGTTTAQVEDGVRPIVNAASAAGDMTDTDIIYVYVGETTVSLTNGDWYFYDGSAWVSGGAYNSTALVTDKTLTQTDMAADSKKVGDEITDLKSAIEQGGTGVSVDLKQALLQLAQKVVYKDDGGQTYYDDLYDALYPPIVVTNITLNTNSLSFATLNSTQQLTATTTPTGGGVTWTSSNTSVATVSATGLVTAIGYGNATITATSGNVSATCSVAITQATVSSISAVYTQSGTVHATDSLDVLKADLVVTAFYNNSTSEIVSTYTLSGTLAEGTSTITVTYGDKTTTFEVTVASEYELLYTITPSDMVLCGSSANVYQSATGGYYYAGNTNLIYPDFDLLISHNHRYKIEISSDTDQANVYLNPTGTAALVTNHSNINPSNLGVQTSPYEFTVSYFDNKESLRVLNPVADNLEHYKIYKYRDLAECELDNSLWAAGYISSGGAISSSSNGERYTMLAIPVTAGHTYRFANSNQSWDTDWASYTFVQSDLVTKSSRNTMTSLSDHFDFTVPTGYSYVLISSRNMENYYETATLTDVTE